MELAESLKRFRKNFNLKQKDVAEVLGVTPQAYQVYESKVTPSAGIIIKIATAFGISADYLLGLTDKPRPLDLPSENTSSENIDLASLQSRINKIESALSAQGIKI